MNCPYCNNIMCAVEYNSMWFECRLCIGNPQFVIWDNVLHSYIFTVNFAINQKIVYYYPNDNSLRIQSSLIDSHIFKINKLLTPSNIQNIVDNILKLNVFL